MYDEEKCLWGIRMTREEMIITVVCSIIGSGVLSAFISHILYRSKLKKEQGIKFQNMIGERIADALNKAYELADQLKITEKYKAHDQMKIGLFDAFDKKDLYPAIMSGPDTLNKFMTEVSEFRGKTEKFLDSKLTLDLVYLERYIFQLNVYASGFGKVDFFPLLGMIIEPDLDKWYVSFVKRIVKNQNKTKCKIECHFGKRWARLRKKFVEKRWINSDLYKVINNAFKKNDDPHLKKVSEILKRSALDNKVQKFPEKQE